MDIETRTVLWEQGIYQGEFDEPGEVEIANDGTCYICQDFNLFTVNKSGTLEYKKMWAETGKRYKSLAVSGDGSRLIAFLEEADTTLDKTVEVYDSRGTVLWAVEAQLDEFSHTVDVSENGKYFGVCDAEGARIFDRSGKLLFQDERGDSRRYHGTGLAIANNGRFVYGLANRIYYGELK